MAIRSERDPITGKATGRKWISGQHLNKFFKEIETRNYGEDTDPQISMFQDKSWHTPDRGRWHSQS